MPKVVSIHSYRGGTGKSNFTANLATTVALQGYRVGMVDTDLPSPGIHNLFGLESEPTQKTLFSLKFASNSRAFSFHFSRLREISRTFISIALSFFCFDKALSFHFSRFSFKQVG